MKNCDEYLEKISCLIDGELQDSEKQDVLDHIAMCETCRSFYETFGAASLEFEGNEIDVPDGFTRSVMAEIKETKAKKRPAPFRRFAGLAAGVILLVGVAAAISYGSGGFKTADDSMQYSYNEAAQEESVVGEAYDGAYNMMPQSEAGTTGFLEMDEDFGIGLQDAQMYGAEGYSRALKDPLAALQYQAFPTGEELLWSNRMMWNEITMINSRYNG